jgi:hypothetical protein
VGLANGNVVLDLAAGGRVIMRPARAQDLREALLTAVICAAEHRLGHLVLESTDHQPDELVLWISPQRVRLATSAHTTTITPLGIGRLRRELLAAIRHCPGGRTAAADRVAS